MRWQGRRQSGNVVDRRGARGGMGGLPIGGRGVALSGGGAVVFFIIIGIYLLAGGDPQLLTDVTSSDSYSTSTQELSPEQQQAAQFVSVVLADTEDVWNKIFLERGATYREPKLILFSGGTRSGCGFASSAVGPFYCPADQSLYIDLDFFAQLCSKLNAPGDFAQAYVIAHEVGHHVQNLLGTMDKVQSARASMNEREYNQLSVRLELQADFLAGVWAHHADQMFDILEPGDLDEALRAASAVGDDTLQKHSQGHVVPDSFTHGTSAQRRDWFKRGYDTGDISQGDTFAAGQP